MSIDDDRRPRMANLGQMITTAMKENNPYTAPQEKPVDRPEVSASCQRRYESLDQRFLSGVLLFVVLTGPLWVGTIGAVFSRGWTSAVANSALSAAIIVWLAATGWLVVRVIWRIRSKSTPYR